MYGLDFAAVLQMGAAQSADLALLSEVLPEVEGFIVVGLSSGEDE